MQNSDKYKEELFEMYLLEKYEEIVDQLIKIRLFNHKEYFSLIMAGDLVDELNRKLPIVDFTAIVEYELELPTSNKIDYLYYWSKILLKLLMKSFMKNCTLL